MTDNDYVEYWVLPAGLTLQEAQAHPGAQNTFPQQLTTRETAPCGSVIQQDGYNADPSAVTADGILSWVGGVDGHPEDSGLYAWHTFYETPACVVVTPTPTPTPTPGPPVVIVEIGTPVYNPPILAETGPALASAIGYAAVMLVLVGVILVVTVWTRGRH